MNAWKMTSLVLAGALALFVGKDAFSRASAAEPAATDQPSIGYDWAKEQPNMEKALKDLQAARGSLQVAAENKGGWRVLALKHVDESIAEVRRGMEYAKNHPHDE